MNGSKKTYITVCKNVILYNLKHGTNKPAIRVSQGLYGKPAHFHDYYITGLNGVRVTCDMANPLPWGARVWIEIDR